MGRAGRRTGARGGRLCLPPLTSRPAPAPRGAPSLRAGSPHTLGTSPGSQSRKPALKRALRAAAPARLPQAERLRGHAVGAPPAEGARAGRGRGRRGQGGRARARARRRRRRWEGPGELQEGSPGGARAHTRRPVSHFIPWVDAYLRSRASRLRRRARRSCLLWTRRAPPPAPTARRAPARLCAAVLPPRFPHRRPRNPAGDGHALPRTPRPPALVPRAAPPLSDDGQPAHAPAQLARRRQGARRPRCALLPASSRRTPSPLRPPPIRRTPTPTPTRRLSVCPQAFRMTDSGQSTGHSDTEKPAHHHHHHHASAGSAARSGPGHRRGEGIRSFAHGRVRSGHADTLLSPRRPPPAKTLKRILPRRRRRLGTRRRRGRCGSPPSPRQTRRCRGSTAAGGSCGRRRRWSWC